jgi:hypothetical protein
MIHAVRNDMLNPCSSRDQWRPVALPTSREDDGIEIEKREAAKQLAEISSSAGSVASATDRRAAISQAHQPEVEGNAHRSQRPLF